MFHISHLTGIMFWIFHLGGGSISLELILLPKRFLGPTNFGSNKIVGPITFCVEKKIYSKEYWVKKTLVRKNFRSTKVFGPTKFLVQQNYGSNKLSGPTKFWVKKSNQTIFRQRACLHTWLCEWVSLWVGPPKTFECSDWFTGYKTKNK